jgi:hypothetical protein
MRKVILLLVVLFGCQLNAQIKVKINGKPFLETSVIKAEEIKKMEVAFDKYKKLDYYGLGRLFLYIEFLDEQGNLREEYGIRKDGTNAIKVFLDDVNVYYLMATDTDAKTDIIAFRTHSDRNITTKLRYFGKNFDSKTVKVRISLTYNDKVGYEKYGDAINLIKPQTYTIDNTLYFNEGQKEKEQDKIVAAEKAAEKAKADEEAKKQADAEAKKGKGKKLIKNVLGW